MKHNRHIKILSIIQERSIRTQEELAEALLSAGYNVTQATVSRDIKDLKLVKKTDETGNVRYSADKKNKEVISERLITVLKQSYISSDPAGNLLVVKTLPGMAQAAASAIDAYDFENLAGTIAGDDTIFVAMKTYDDVLSMMAFLNSELR
ncbi:MAG TPA: arginine repressor [Clostridia bacterium]|nr:arginine repressor [Clostridia bacterium]